MSNNIIAMKDNKTVFVTYKDGSMDQFIVENQKVTLKKTTQPCSNIDSLKFSENEKILFISCGLKGLKLQDIQSGTIIKELSEVSYQIKIINQKIYSSSDLGLSIYSADSYDLIQKIESQEIGQAIFFDISPDENYFFQANESRFQAVDISDVNNPKIIVTDSIELSFGIKNTVFHPKKTIVFIPTQWDRIIGIDYSKFNGQSYPIPFVEEFIFVDESYSRKNDLWISPDGNFLLNTQVGQGVIIIDCSDITNMFVYQKIEILGSLQKMYIQSQNMDFLYVTTSLELLIYKRSYPEIVEINMFTQSQSKIWFDNVSDIWPWEHAFSHNFSRFYVCYGVDGVILYDTSNLPELKEKRRYVDPEIPGLKYVIAIQVDIKNENIIYTGCWSNRAFFILDLTDWNKPILLSEVYIKGEFGMHITQFNRDPNKLIVTTLFDIYIMDVEDKKNPKKHSEMIGAEDIIQNYTLYTFLNKKETHMYSADFTKGYIFIGKIAEDFKTITITNSTIFNSARQAQKSQIHDRILWALSYTDGFAVYDVGDNYDQLEQIAFLQIEGNMFKMDISDDETAAFLPSVIKNTLVTVDIHDYKNPKILNVLKIPSETGLITVHYKIPQRGDFLIYTSQTGVSGYISPTGYPTQKFNLNEIPVIPGEQNQQNYASGLHEMLKAKVFQIPIYLIIEPSLIFNNMLNKSQNNQKIIETYASNLEVVLTVDENKAAFFQHVFQGIIVSYSGNQNQISLSGKKEVINQFISDVKLEIFEKENLEVNVYISDGLNEDINKSFLFEELLFLQVNQHISKGNSLQEQFNRLYSNGEVYVQEQFTFQFIKNTFMDEDPLTYKVYVRSNQSHKKMVEVTNSLSFENCWYSFDSNLRTFKGECEQSKFRESAYIQVVASDGFSVLKDSFIVKYYKIPPFTILYYVVFIGSGILTFFGIFKYRGKFYGILCKRLYRTGNYYIIPGEDFIIQIILNKDGINLGKQSLNKILKYQKKNKIQLSSLFQNNDMKSLHFDKQIVIKQFKQVYTDVDEKQFENEYSYHYMIFKALYLNHIFQLKQFKQERKIFKNLKNLSQKQKNNISNRWYENYVQIKPALVQDEHSCLPSIVFKTEPILSALKTILKLEISTKDIYLDMSIVPRIFDKNFQKYLIEKQTQFNNINLIMIFSMIYIHTLGLTPINEYSLIYSKGQSITQNIQKIKIVKAMKKRKNILNPLLALINQDYLDIPFSSNMPLPSWCDYKYHNNVIEIFGCIPVEEDSVRGQQNYLIRIEDENNVTLREFQLIQVNNIEECSEQLLIKNMDIDNALVSSNGIIKIKSQEKKKLCKMVQKLTISKSQQQTKFYNSEDQIQSINNSSYQLQAKQIESRVINSTQKLSNFQDCSLDPLKIQQNYSINSPLQTGKLLNNEDVQIQDSQDQRPEIWVDYVDFENDKIQSEFDIENSPDSRMSNRFSYSQKLGEITQKDKQQQQRNA